MAQLELMLGLLIVAGVANITPIFGSKVAWGNYPVDGYMTLGDKRILGDHKTIKGLILGTVTSTLLGLLILPNYPWWLGLALGLGALSGDMIKSFFKRRIDILPGRSWIPFDQVDWVIGYLLVAALFVPINWWMVVASMGLGILLHLFFKALGYVVKINKEPI